MKPTTVQEQLERYFEQDYNPSPSSPVAARMRELLESNPDCSFDELRLLAIDKIRSARETPK